VTAVWDRILTAPDDSSLQIVHRGRKIGFCRWVATVNEDLPPAAEADAQGGQVIEGRVQGVTGYSLDLDGHCLFEDSPRRLRFAARVEFAPDRVWRTFQLRLQLKPSVWEIRADARSEQLILRVETDGSVWERALAFAELGRPERLLASLGVPWGTAWLTALAQGLEVPEPATLALGLTWEARSDWFTWGHSRLRAYRVEAELLDKYRATVVVSRVGEILRVELPEDLVLANEALIQP